MNTLQKIREAVIACHPEKFEVDIRRKGEGLAAYDAMMETLEEVTLADILLAIYAVQPANKTLVTLECDGQFVITSYDNAGKLVQLGATWNLRRDNLEDQSLETIGFIGSILGV